MLALTILQVGFAFANDDVPHCDPRDDCNSAIRTRYRAAARMRPARIGEDAAARARVGRGASCGALRSSFMADARDYVTGEVES